MNYTHTHDSHIQHDPNVPLVALHYQLLEVIRRPKVRVDLCDILLPVAMVTSIRLLRNRGDPDCIHPQSLDVIQLVADAPKRASTVVTEITTGGAAVPFPGKPVSQELGGRREGCGIGGSGEGVSGEWHRAGRSELYTYHILYNYCTSQVCFISRISVNYRSLCQD